MARHTMPRRRRWGLARPLVLPALLFVFLPLLQPASARAGKPDAGTFPAFQVPGREADMAILGDLFRRHHSPGTTTTLWDPWLPMSVLWPAIGPSGTADHMRGFIRSALLERRIDGEGYVATQQHRGLAHSDGWPFPLWMQAQGAGWHFSLAHDVYGVQNGARPTTSLDGWELLGFESQGIDPANGLKLKVTGPRGAITTPGFRVASLSAPFIRIEWSAKGLPASARPALEWSTEEAPRFEAARRVEFAPLSDADGMRYTMIPLYKRPSWGGTLTRLRLTFAETGGAEIVLKSVITSVDSRHPINNAVYLQACADYFDWTTDLDFLRANIGRMRKALHFALDEFAVRQNHCVVVPWVGHDGRSGLTIGPDGKKQIHVGQGVGNNYWDILPFGGQDFQATLYLFHALQRMAELERLIAAHPDWNIPDADHFDPADLTQLAEAIKSDAGKRFWNDRTGRFVGWIDRDGKAYDYGFTTTNCEAVHLGLATPAQARSIVDWLDGTRTVEGDTSRARIFTTGGSLRAPRRYATSRPTPGSGRTPRASPGATRCRTAVRSWAGRTST